MLLSLFFFSLFSFFSILFIPKKNVILIKQISLILSFVIFIYCIYLFFLLDHLYVGFQFKETYYFFNGLTFSLGVDGISIFFLLLTAILFPICFIVNWESVKYRSKDFCLMLLLLEFFLLNVFLSLDLFFFYIFFEGVLIPMFFIIGIWGSRQRKIHAVYQFFLYTFFGSILMLFSIFIIYLHVGSTHLELIKETAFSEQRQLLLWLCFFIAFAIKVPMIPFHIWLPEAHVEAPTSGSILLAGILLKLGTYGFIRFLITLFPYANAFFTPLVIVICLFGVIYGSFGTIRQVDLKKIIAYSSVVHMNFAIIGLFSKNLEGVQGSFFLMISHGIISGALFLCIGILYDRYHTRILYYYGGLVNVMPIFSVIFLVFILSNMGFPGTSGFVGEILVLISFFSFNPKVAILLATSMVFSAVYSLWLYNRVIFGEIKSFFFIPANSSLGVIKKWFGCFSDITRREFFALLPFFVLNIILGIYPNAIFNTSYFCFVDTIVQI